MYGLPQAGILAQELLEQRLNKHGYFQNKAITGLWMHQTRPISFTLVVDSFGIKYIGQEHVMHLFSILKKHYKLSEDWKGTKFIGLRSNGTTQAEKCTYPCLDTLMMR